MNPEIAHNILQQKSIDIGFTLQLTNNRFVLLPKGSHKYERWIELETLDYGAINVSNIRACVRFEEIEKLLDFNGQSDLVSSIHFLPKLETPELFKEFEINEVADLDQFWAFFVNQINIIP